MGYVTTNVQGGVAILTVSNPPVNALHPKVLQAIADAHAAAVSNVRVPPCLGKSPTRLVFFFCCISRVFLRFGVDLLSFCCWFYFFFVIVVFA